MHAPGHISVLSRHRWHHWDSCQSLVETSFQDFLLYGTGLELVLPSLCTGSDFHSDNWVASLGSRSYGSYHPHTMEGIIAIQCPDIVVNIVCKILDKLGYEVGYVCSIG